MFKEVLPAADRRDFGFFTRLSDDQKKGFSAPVILRAASIIGDGPQAARQIEKVNERANLNFHALYKHPDLQYRLIASCGTGRQQFHPWIAGAKSGKKTDKVTLFLARFHPTANDFELDILLSKFTDETFRQFVRSSGITDAEEKEVLEAYDRLTGKAKSPKKKAKG
jgi:hypothetical protein